MAAYVGLGEQPPWRTWPRRMLGSDAILLLGLAGGFVIAYWLSFRHGGLATTGSARPGAPATGCGMFSLFDSIHRTNGGYSFLMQSKAKDALDPGQLTQYPPGQHYIYALADIFLRSNMNPGSTVDEFNRYNVWVSLGYGFFVLCVAWAARWVAGPALSGWRRVFLVTAIGAFLAIGSFSSAIWCTWDPQVFGMGLLALLAAFCFRPPTGMRTHVALMALLFIAICMTYELFAPFAVILIAVSLWTYRKRLLPHWKALLGVTVVSVPLALSEYAAAHAAGLSGSSSATSSTGFTIPLSWAVLTVLGCFSVLGFAARPARRLPSAQAALIAVLLSALAVLALAFYVQPSALANVYYFQKVVQAWAVVMMVGAGFFGHLLRRPKLPNVGWKGFGVGVCALLLAIGATRSFWWSTQYTQGAPLSANNPNPGANWSLGSGTTWASMWIGGSQAPDNIGKLATLQADDLLLTHIPTITVVFRDSGSNVDLSLQLAVLNQNAGLMGAVNYALPTDQYRGLNASGGLVCAGVNGTPWTAQDEADLAQLEAGIKAVGVPVRVIVASQPLQNVLEQWGAHNPGAIRDVMNLPSLAPNCAP